MEPSGRPLWKEYMSLQILYKTKNFNTTEKIFEFLRRTLFHGVGFWKSINFTKLFIL
jgi:hypothetical protein